MSNVQLPFAQHEYDRRVTKTRHAMSQAGLDVIVVSDPSSMAWLTGYDGWSFYVHQAVVLGLEGEPIWWGRAMDASGAKRTVFMGHDNILGYDDHYVQSSERHPMDDLARQLAKHGWQNASIGVEMDNYWYSAKAHACLCQGLPNAKFKDATGLVNWQRLIKSAPEIVFMRRAARIVEEMHSRILELAEPGLRKNELVAEVYKTAISGADGHWGDYPAVVPMLPSGMDATAPHLTWDDRPFETGESTFFEIAGCYRRYNCPQSRTLFLGKAPQKYLDAEAAVLEALEAGLDMARPGHTCEEVAVKFYQSLEARGFSKDSRTGYSIGLSYPPDWGERTISLRRGDHTVLEPGIIIHFMPALWLDDGGLEITEPILITEDGAECLCTTPRQLFVKT